MHMEETIDPTQVNNVREMLTVAGEYCLFFSRSGEMDKQEILEYFQKVAPLLYLKGSLLPAIEATDPSFNERFVTEEQWESVFKSLRETFGEDDTWFVLDQHGDSTKVSMAEHMTDIYQDMQDFVLLYAKNTLMTRENAVDQVRKWYFYRWGPELLSTLPRVHCLLHPPEEGIEADWYAE